MSAQTITKPVRQICTGFSVQLRWVSGSEFRVTGEVTNTFITNVNIQNSIQLNLHIREGVVFTLPTNYGNKWARFDRCGVVADALQYVDVDN